MCKLAKTQSEYPDSVWLHQQMKEERQFRCRSCMKCPMCQEMLTVRDFTKDSSYCRDCERKQHVRRSKRMRVTAYDHQVLQKSQPDWWKKARKDMIRKYEKIVRTHNPTYWQTRTWMLYMQAQGMSTTVWRPTRWVQAIVFTRSLSSISQTTIHFQVEKDKSSLLAYWLTGILAYKLTSFLDY